MIKKEYTVAENLVLEIYTIGYKSMGESIVVKILVDNIVVYCFVIDCFEDGENKTLEIIGESKVDLICLTHPDFDHCKGLNKILQKANNETLLLYPASIFSKKYKREVKKVVDKIALLNKMNNNNLNKPILKECQENMQILRRVYFTSEKGGKYELEIETYSPLTQILGKREAEEYLEEETAELVHNQMSIMMTITLGNFKMLLTGDIENKTIKLLNREQYISNYDFFEGTIDYLKLPHHGSDGSLEMINLLEKVDTISQVVTTTYKKKELPRDSVINAYKRKTSEIYCTSDLNAEKQIDRYGIIKTTVDIINETIHPELLGNSTKIL